MTEKLSSNESLWIEGLSNAFTIDDITNLLGIDDRSNKQIEKTVMDKCKAL